MTVAAQSRLVAALRNVLDTHGAGVRVIETHISYVLLTGERAYKIKKAVDLGFLDFRTLASRRFYCEEELKLNRRLAPDVYLDVVAITGSIDAPAIGGDGTPIEYAVRMREFRQDALATRILSGNAMDASFVDELAVQVARLHGAAQAADSGGTRGDASAILANAMRNFERMRPAAGDSQRLRELDALRQWTLAEHAAIAPIMDERRGRARVRECHGDLHLGNIAQIDGRPLIFDCIEFSEDLRWIDVMSDVAFLVMDFRDRGRPDLGHRFLNAYLEITGDYDGLRVLPFYLVYRAMVRAMVASERAAQLGAGTPGDALTAECHGYLALAARYAYARDPAIVITHGFSGCGKTTSSQSLVETMAGVRIRTDVERKRLHGLRPTDRDPAGLDATIYSPEVTRWVYLRVLALARVSLAAGFATIVDGAFLWRWQRQLFRDLAAELRMPFVIVTFKAREATLRARILRRMQEGSDASDAGIDVLERQLRSYDALDQSEIAHCVAIDTEAPAPALSSRDRWREVVIRLARQRSAAEAPRREPSAATG
jgi:aminoglycoside phosphotransferase family enzyme/predicted kinase